ncbi:transcriptional regulator [Flavobacterium rivuli WB 3.3-2 = DSM 21788]|uniref:Transcriptional regulator n=1 Tax=Flavobacterium rivuli WB 3.3-2 = DSM 21788 TaxID=1121895 RepID=A0A0A2M7M5_9FLAO|nr:AraC family transcriptional regulator [Flavobacterium rivuli]KGO87473.1 transcriptional regulator [Flavobacterium rivuli WB 3.3-2 = DSM 21788]
MADFINLNSLYKQLLGESPSENNVGMGHFNIIKVEDLVTEGKPKHTSYSRRSFFKVSLVNGDCIVHYADRSIVVNGYALVFTNPVVPYKWEVISKKQLGYVCVFTEALFNRYAAIKDFPVFSSPDKAVVLLNAAQYKNFESLFIKMENELQSDYTYKYDFLRNLLMEVIHEAQKLQPETGIAVSASNASERIATLFTDLLERQFTIESIEDVVLLKSPSDFAGKLNMHVNHLNKALKQATGQTTSQLIRDRIVHEAKVLLKTTNWAIAEIARCLGFEEPNHFSIFFKEHTLLTPGAFRKEN